MEFIPIHYTSILRFQIKEDSGHKYRIDGDSFTPNTWFHIVLAYKGPTNG